MAASIRPLFALLSLLLLAGLAQTADMDRAGDALPPNAVARLGTNRLRHGGAITSITFAPDGKTFATTSADRTVSVWERETGRELVRCRGFAREPLATAFSADGQTLTCAAADGTARVFSVAVAKDKPLPIDATELHTFSLGFDHTPAVGFSGDGSLLAAGDEDGQVRLWDVKARKAIVEFKTEGVRCLALSPDGKTMATTTSINGIRTWDTKTGQKISALGKGAYSVLAFCAGGNELAAGNFDNQMELFNPSSATRTQSYTPHKEIMPISKNGVACVAYSPSMDHIATGGGDGRVVVWRHRQFGKQQPPTVFDGHTDRVTAVAFSPDGKWMVSGAADNTIRIYDATEWKEAMPADIPPAPLSPLAGMTLSPDGKYVAALETAGGRLSLWDAHTGKPAEPIAKLPGKAAVAGFSPDGKTLVFGFSGSQVDLWDLKTGKPREGWRIKETEEDKAVLHPVPGIVFDAAGKRLALCSAQGMYISVWEPAEGKRLAVFTASGGRRAHTVALSPDGSTAASAGTEALVRLWDVDNDKEKGTLEGHSGGTLALAYAPNGRLIATGGKDRMIRVWEVATGKERQAFGGQPGWVRAVAFAPDGNVLATANTDGVVRLWDLTNGRLLHELIGHRGAVTRLAFSARGEVLATAGADTTVVIWDTAKLLKDRKASVVTLTQKELDRVWEQLSSNDSGEAAAALQTFARAPAQAVPLMKQHVKPIKSEQLAQWVKELDHDRFPVREAAAKELAAAGKFAEPTLKLALEKTSSAEVRRSVEALLEKLRDRGPSPEELRLMRSLEALEMIGNDEAKLILKRVVAEGAAESELTRQAKAALERLAKREP